MSGGSSGLPRVGRIIVACVLVSVSISAPQEMTKSTVLAMAAVKEKKRSAPRTSVLPPSPPVLKAPGGREKPEPKVLEESGKIPWAKGYEGILIAGFDDGLYEPYARPVIEKVQRALRDRGLYSGPVNGVLDKPTMKAIYDFQTANKILQRCGVPTPFTRKMLEQGSHTDPAS